MADRPWQNKETLKELYINQGLTTAEIGNKLGCTDVTISDWLDRHNIPARDPDPPTMTGSDHPRSITKKEIINDYRQLGEKLDKTPSQEEYNKHGKYTWSAIRGHFDGMGEIQDAAGLERHQKGRVTLECEICGEEYSEKHSKKDNSRFCSPECDATWKATAYTVRGTRTSTNRSNSLVNGVAKRTLDRRIK